MFADKDALSRNTKFRWTKGRKLLLRQSSSLLLFGLFLFVGAAIGRVGSAVENESGPDSPISDHPANESGAVAVLDLPPALDIMDLPDFGPRTRVWSLFPTPSTWTLHIVQPNESFDGVAEQNGISYNDLEQWNPGARESRLMPGDTLRFRRPEEKPGMVRVSSREIRRGPRGRRALALTFDCGWATRKDLDELLSTLDQLDVQATFFLTGVFLDQAPDGASLILAKGHELGNHSRSHPHFTRLTTAQMREQLLSVENRVLAGDGAAGPSTRPFWRPPYGESDRRVLETTAEIGFQSIGWTIDSRDWFEDPPATVESVFERVCVRPLEGGDDWALDGAIVLLHLAARPTPGAVRKMVPFLREKGYQLLTVGEILRPDYSPR